MIAINVNQSKEEVFIGGTQSSNYIGIRNLEKAVMKR